VEAVIAGERVVLMPERALFRPATGQLLIADAHWGKAATFRAAGIAVPGGTTAEGLERMDSALAYTGAREIVFLGDLFHARQGKSAAVLAAVRAWRARHPALRLVLVRGNHDRGAGDPPLDLGFDVVDPPRPSPPFVYAHHPDPHPGGYVLAGHVHPAVVLRGPGRMRERLPCFHFGARVGVLPAFGAFTGTANVTPQPGDHLYVVAHDEVLRAQ
jgi:DNA ligase-associated metallophosphoesterase